MTDTRLTAQSRADALDRLRRSVSPGQELDVLIIGGGITGAGIALDAASRGLSTAIVEAQDWAEGTSSRSSKLVHGGLRYLRDAGLQARHRGSCRARSAAHRGSLPLGAADPVLVHPIRHRVWERAFVGAGIMLYDILATLRRGRRALPWHRHLGRRGVAAAF